MVVYELVSHHHVTCYIIQSGTMLTNLYYRILFLLTCALDIAPVYIHILAN